MAGFLKFGDISTAVHNKKNKMDISSNTITSLDFYKLVPTTFRPVFPNESFDFNVGALYRLTPQFKPLFGRAKVVNRFFFVPFYQLFDAWNSFFTQQPWSFSGSSTVIVNECPYFKDQTLVDLFTTSFPTQSVHLADKASDSDTHFDFQTWDGDSAKMQKYNFTNLGKSVHDILVGLGYKVIWSSNMDLQLTEHRNALPLLAYFKIWSDWFANPSYAYFNIIQRIVRRTYSNSASLELTLSDLQDLFWYGKGIYCESDYFISAWDNPTGPNSSGTMSGNTIQFKDITLSGNDQQKSEIISQGVSSNNGTPYIAKDNTTPYVFSFSQYILDGLKAATDFITRKRLVGNRVIDAYLAEKGLMPKIEEMNRSKPLAAFDIPIQFGEVIATTASQDEGQPLGDYAGKAIGYTKSPQSFKFDAQDQAGVIIGLSYIEPDSGWVDGINRFNSTTKALDFYQEDFDHLGVQAIRYDEIYGNNATSDPYDGVNPADIWAYTPRYAHLKVGTNFDCLNGDFYRGKTRESYDRWHLFRNTSNMYDSPDAAPKHSASLMEGDFYKDQYSRIFADSNYNFDHFFGVYQFQVTKYTPMTSLWDNYEFNKEEEHRHVNMRINGTSLTD